MAKSWVGISGWSFAPWRGSFYPEDLVQRRELEYASRALSSIEVNGTFYSLQRPTSFQSWYRETPADSFCFAVKAPQFITHVLRLKDCEEPLANFLASGILALKEKLGVILWQFPPFVMLKDDRFEKFFKLLPHTGRAAAKLAQQHGDKVKGRSLTEAPATMKLRHAFEFRHKSFLNRDFLDTMKAHNVAFVCAPDAAEKSPYTEEPTADFVYVRMHGEGKKFAKGYPDKELAAWAKRVEAWKKQGLDAYVYLSNEAKEHSPASAMKLLKRLGEERPMPVTKKRTAKKAA
jgi:uncharacterized protein YecE (DUF72 family)